MAAPAGAQTIGFEGVAAPGTAVVGPFGYTESGYAVDYLSSYHSPTDFRIDGPGYHAIVCPNCADNGTSVWVWNANRPGYPTQVSRVDGGAFDILSIDLALLSGPPLSTEYRLTGYLMAGGTVVLTTVAVSGPTTVAVNFFGLSRLEIVQLAYYDGAWMDNLVLQPSAPVISSASASPNVLWPPNHKMVNVTVAVSASSGGSVAPVCRIAAVTSNEPITAPGETDFVVTGPLTVQLRAERAGAGAGRVYTISVRCTNGSSPAATRDIRVSVPHDRSR